MNSDPLIVVHQPDFIPYLGFFHRLLLADIFVVLDHVQMNKEGWVHRDKIKTSSGWKWITLPLHPFPLKTPICEVKISNTQNWKLKHLNSVTEAYRKASFFNEIFPYYQKLYMYNPLHMSDFTLASIMMLLRLFDIPIPVVRSSDMSPEGRSNALVAELVVKAGGRRYLSGLGAKAYFDPIPFNKAGVSVIWQKFEHPVYPQLHGDFLPMLTSLDLLFNCGIDQSRQILKSCVNAYD
jgi:hypothetical protein